MLTSKFACTRDKTNPVKGRSLSACLCLRFVFMCILTLKIERFSLTLKTESLSLESECFISTLSIYNKETKNNKETKTNKGANLAKDAQAKKR